MFWCMSALSVCVYIYTCMCVIIDIVFCDEFSIEICSDTRTKEILIFDLHNLCKKYCFWCEYSSQNSYIPIMFISFSKFSVRCTFATWCYITLSRRDRWNNKTLTSLKYSKYGRENDRRNTIVSYYYFTLFLCKVSIRLNRRNLM